MKLYVVIVSLLLTGQQTGESFLFHGQIRRQICTSFIGAANKGVENGPDFEGIHGYIDGLEYPDKEAEILAMGGDPFFLPVEGEEYINMDDDDDDFPLMTSMTSASISDKDDSSDDQNNQTTEPFEWDGQIDEDAFFD